MDAPREDLIRMRSLPSQDLLRAAGDGNTLVGYPIVFNTWTEINNWEGNFLERIDPGALNKTLADRSDQVKVLFNHGMDPQIGDKPLGKPRTMKPDKTGLWTETPLDETSYNADLIASLRSGALDGMSFRFSVVRDELVEPEEPSDYNPKLMPERTILELKLYEFGPVTFPAYAASSAGVRATPRAFEAWTRANGGTPPSDPIETSADGPAQTTRADESEPADATRMHNPPSEPVQTTRDDQPAGDATGDLDDEPLDGPSLPAAYIPARRPAKNPDRRQADRDFIRAICADIDSRKATHS